MGPLTCDFCHRPQHVVDKLISSPAGRSPRYICDRCVGEGISRLNAKDLGREDPFLKRLLRGFKGRQGNFSVSVEPASGAQLQ
jgi:hypothetical protein